MGTLLERDLPNGRLGLDCQRIGAGQTLALGARAFDILHVASARLLKADRLLSFDRCQRSLAVAVGLGVAP